MTSNDATGTPGSGDPADDATRADWPIGSPQQLPPAQALPPSPAASGAASPPPGGPPPGPGSAPPPSPPSPGGYAPAAGYAPGYAQAPAPGMAWAPPPEAYGAPAASGLAYAGALPRLIAWIVDGLILGLVGLVLGAAAFALFAGSVNWSEILTPGNGTLGKFNGGPAFAALAVAAVIAALIQLGYFVFFWTSGAKATLGMRLLRLQVANAADGARLTTGQAVRRWIALGQWLGLLRYVPFVGVLSGLVQLVWYLVVLGTTATSPTKQGVHDRFAGSVVVQPSGGSSNGMIIGCLVIVAFLLLVPLIAIVALIALGGQVSSIVETVGNSV